MNKEQEKLIEMLKDNKIIIEYKRLEKIVSENGEFAMKIEKLHDLQKSMILSDSIKKQNEYITIKAEIEDHPIIANYLELQQEINALLQQIIGILEGELAIT